MPRRYMTDSINIFTMTMFDQHHISLKIHRCFPPTYGCFFLPFTFVLHFAIYLSLSSSQEFPGTQRNGLEAGKFYSGMSIVKRLKNVHVFSFQLINTMLAACLLCELIRWKYCKIDITIIWSRLAGYILNLVVLFKFEF